MNKRVKKLWIKALQSRKYKQGRNMLRDDDCFCCLGVLCDLFRIDRRKGRWLGASFIAPNSTITASSLPAAVQEWAGLSVSNPRLGKRSDSPTAIALNDTEEKDFAYIADRIEKYL